MNKGYRAHDGSVTAFRIIDVISALVWRTKRVHRGVRVERDVAFSTRGKRPVCADVYFPDKKGPYPVFLNIHGGGFVAGDKKYRGEFCSSIARRGYLVFNVNYTLCNRAPFPEFLADLVDAVRYLEENAGELSADLTRLVIGGDSAGAYMSSLLGVALQNPEYEDKFNLKLPSVRPSALVLLCGLYSFRHIMKRGMIFNLDLKIASYVVGKKIKCYEDLDNVENSAFLDVTQNLSSSFPPSFITMSSKDVLCGGEGEYLVEKLIKEGVEITTHCVDDRMHCWHLNPRKKSREVRSALYAYLDEIKTRGEI